MDAAGDQRLSPGSKFRFNQGRILDEFEHMNPLNPVITLAKELHTGFVHLFAW